MKLNSIIGVFVIKTPYLRAKNHLFRGWLLVAEY
jgi:hypothetical protein